MLKKSKMHNKMIKTLTKNKMKTENIKIKLIQNINRNYNSIVIMLFCLCKRRLLFKN